jgi:hypothetical protein
VVRTVVRPAAAAVVVAGPVVGAVPGGPGAMASAAVVVARPGMDPGAAVVVSGVVAGWVVSAVAGRGDGDAAAESECRDRRDCCE